MILGSNSGGNSAATGVNTDPTASNAPAQRGRIPARNVAMPNSKGPKIYMGPDIFHSVGRTPRSVSLAIPVNIPRKPSTNAGDSVTRRGRINDSTKEKGIMSPSQMLNRTKPARPSQPDFSACLAYSPAMPNSPKKPMATAKMWTFTQVAVVTDEGTLSGWNIPTTMKHSPATMADKPAQRMRVDVFIFVLFSLIAIFPLVFICLSPF